MLFRDATLALAHALLNADDGNEAGGGLSPADTLRNLQALLNRMGQSAPPELLRQLPLLTDTSATAVEQLVPDVHLVTRDLDVVTRWLSALVDARVLRTGGTRRRTYSAVFAILLLAGAAAWSRAASDPNVALGAVASSSSRGKRTSAQGAIDGFRYGQLGFYSSREDSPWLKIDLGQPHDITRVATYGRGDCCFADSIPLALEVSEDDVSYEILATRKRSFSQYAPWVVRPKPVTARFVRLRALVPAHLVLGEVEVYGKPQSASD